MAHDLLAEAAERGIRVPLERTLAKYGLDPLAWVELLSSQDWKCAVCTKTRATWNTDHEHVPGWGKMPPEQRRIFVRGVLCWHCNRHVVPSNLSAAAGRRVADYLSSYEKRRNIALGKECP